MRGQESIVDSCGQLLMTQKSEKNEDERLAIRFCFASIVCCAFSDQAGQCSVLSNMRVERIFGEDSPTKEEPLAVSIGQSCQTKLHVQQRSDEGSSKLTTVIAVTKIIKITHNYTNELLIINFHTKLHFLHCFKSEIYIHNFF